MITLKNGDPMLNIWFGNFYRPAFDDEDYINKTMELIKQLGFNCVELDSKAWEDFDERFNGGSASQYVKSQEYMMESAKKYGLYHNFLALYLNGDNLYPNIRFSPPIYGESVIDAAGGDGKWYRYWSDITRSSMITHVKGLMNLYSDNLAQLTVDGEIRTPICSMWDPIVAPSFDKDGRERYLRWLAAQYASISDFNKSYETNYKSFNQLQKEDYWFACKYGRDAVYSLEEQKNSSPAFVMWCDNMKWKRAELKDYFYDMQKKFSALSQNLYLSPDMAQWSYFLNVDGSKLSGVGFADLWDTAMRGIDIYELAPFVDNCHFITVPITPAGDPDAYVVSCQHSIMRSMNYGRDFMGGIFWGRFLYNDIYQVLTPCEIVGSIVASGAKGIWAYGINGLDDGGMLDRMDKCFLDSLSLANTWAKQVIPLLEGKPITEIAILFPSAMASFEPFTISGNDTRRMDLPGWYKACCDLGYTPDVINLTLIESGILAAYKVLVLPADSCYKIEANAAAEKIIGEWIKNGGVLLHGPNNLLAERCSGVRGKWHEKDCAFYEEGILPGGKDFAAFEGEEVIAEYISDKKGCIVRNGSVYSFGFYYGSSYAAKIAPHVPLSQKNNALYPVRLIKKNILDNILRKYLTKSNTIIMTEMPGIETAVFKNGIIIINHTSYPVCLEPVNNKKIFQYKNEQDLLLPRSAVFIFSQTYLT